MRSPSRAVTFALLLGCTAALCQQKIETVTVKDVAPPPSPRFPARWYPADTVPVTESLVPVTGDHYTAVAVQTSTFQNPQTGKTDVRVDKGFTARDSHGRTRVEDPPSGAVNGVPIRNVRVQDPVSHCSFHWDEPAAALVASPERPVAIVTCLPRTVNYVYFDIWAQKNFTSVRDVTSDTGSEHGEPLGKRMFGEVEAIGVRNTITRKNAQTGELVTSGGEIWYSPSIREVVRLRSNPTEVPGGTPDAELTEIHLVEPEPALFYPPANYRIFTLAELNESHPPAQARPSVGPSR